jgi:hypothetical protein
MAGQHLLLDAWRPSLTAQWVARQLNRVLGYLDVSVLKPAVSIAFWMSPCATWVSS